MKSNAELLKDIKKYVNEERQRVLPDVNEADLCDNGATYYMNGNDGTMFDWNCNNRTCEFFQFYKASELGVIKVYLCKDGFIRGYYWGDEGRAKGEEITPLQLTSPTNAKGFAKWLNLHFDTFENWDVEV